MNFAVRERIQITSFSGTSSLFGVTEREYGSIPTLDQEQDSNPTPSSKQVLLMVRIYKDRFFTQGTLFLL